MLRPQDTATRERKALDGLWKFRLDDDGVGRAERWYAGSLADARDMAVPASYNDLVGEAREHVGEVWYQRTVGVPRGWADGRIVLYFESATHRATVWVGDEEVARHEGGYTPFEVDITAVAPAGAPVRITVCVDNTLSFQTIPPGVVEQTPAGPKQRYWHDFYNYAGLHRTVWLASTPAARIEDITVVTGLDGTTGTIDYRMDATGADGLDVRVVLRDVEGREIGTATGAVGVVTVPDVHPWAPGDGYLYDLEVQLVDPDSGLVDSYHQSVGVRTVEVRGAEFLINGAPFRFTGFGMHEDHPTLGKGHNPAFLVQDFALLEWIGANSFRTSHYPYSEDVLDLADRHGVVVIDETAAVGLNMGLGGGIFGAQGYQTFSDDTVNEQTRAVHAQAIRELVARDKNHPCVVVWSIANEPDTVAPEARAYFEPLVAETRRLDPTRPVAFANFMKATPELDVVSDLFDVLLLNRYFGWYVYPGDLDSAEQALESELRAWAQLGKPIVMTEYGADTQAGLHSVVAEPWSEEFQIAFLDTYHRVFDRIDAMVGEHVWNFADFATRSGISRVDGNKKGVFTRDRRPKAAAHALRARWRAGT